MMAITVVERENFIGSTIYLIMAIGILSAAGIIGLFSVTIIRDIKKLTYEAQKISTGETDVNINVKRNDEIGELTESFQRIVASLKIMMDIHSLGPAAPVFLERQAKMHLGVHSIEELEQKDVPNHQYWGGCHLHCWLARKKASEFSEQIGKL